MPPSVPRAPVLAPARPFPPDSVGDEAAECFAADDAFAAWIRSTFIDRGALHNPDHEHLEAARIGVLWTNVGNVSKMRTVLATAEIPGGTGSKWKKARADHQLEEWFGSVPDFVITFYAPLCRTLDDRQFCALVEHELYHCAQERDAFGNPRFSQSTGLPIFAIKGHDVEEFVGVVARYGATSPDVQALVKAANARPVIDTMAIAQSCGTCMRAA